MPRSRVCLSAVPSPVPLPCSHLVVCSREPPRSYCGVRRPEPRQGRPRARCVFPALTSRYLLTLPRLCRGRFSIPRGSVRRRQHRRPRHAREHFPGLVHRPHLVHHPSRHEPVLLLPLPFGHRQRREWFSSNCGVWGRTTLLTPRCAFSPRLTSPPSRLSLSCSHTPSVAFGLASSLMSRSLVSRSTLVLSPLRNMCLLRLWPTSVTSRPTL